MDVRNCKECGRLFNYIGYRICPQCQKAREEKFIEVKEYVRKNPNVGIGQVATDNKVTIGQIQQWIREERLILTEAAVGDSILCESCGTPIQMGRFCNNCKKQVTKELERVSAKPPVVQEKKPEVSKKEKMRFLDKNIK